MLVFYVIRTCLQWKFSVIFYATPTQEAHFGDTNRMWDCALEFTHNHGSDEVYVTGAPIGFVNTAFTVENVDVAYRAIEEANVAKVKRVDATTIECLSPTGYVVQLIQRPTKN